MATVTLLTDFGTVDGYVGVMKGILASADPALRMVDIAHDIPQGDLRRAAWALGRFWRYFPEGTVHLVVVDPGVGTDRRGLAVEGAGHRFVVPDNGVITRVLMALQGCEEPVRIHSLDDPRRFRGPPASRTFHGRDLFAPAASFLARGLPIEELGSRVDDPVTLDFGAGRRVAGGAEGEVCLVDRFGNLFTDIPGQWCRVGDTVEIAGRTIGLRSTYGEVEPGGLVALRNSDDLLEVAVRNGSAAELLDIGVGAPVRLRATRSRPTTSGRQRTDSSNPRDPGA